MSGAAMRRGWLAAVWLLAVVLMVAPAPGRAAAAPDIEVFVRSGCVHCEDAERFLAGLQQARPQLAVRVRDVRAEPAALARLQELAQAHAVAAPGVPSFYLRGELIVGYAGEAVTGARIVALLDGAPAAPAVAGDACPPVDSAPLCGPSRPAAAAPSTVVEVPLLGARLDLAELGLPLFTVLLGLLDGFNPCSMWVLIFMISMLATLRNRARMLAVCGVFVAVEGIAYYAFMAAWLNLFLLVGISRVSEIVLGGLALAAGAIHVKDFFAFGRGPTLSIPEAAKPGIYAHVRAILHAPNMAAALAATVVLAVLVQIVELMCTSGFPALYTRILTLHRLEGWSYYGYLLLYNAAYMFDDVVVLAIGVVTLSRRRLQEKEGRWLKLAGGLTMLGLGVYLLAPSS